MPSNSKFLVPQIANPLPPMPAGNSQAFMLPNSAVEESVDLLRVLLILRRNWLLAVGVAATVLLAVSVVSFLAKPVFEPVARIEVDPPGSEMFSLEAGSRGADETDYLETQAEILKSDELAIAVIRELQLQSKSEIVGKGGLREASPVAVTTSSGIQLTSLEELALKSFQSKLNVTLSRNSRIMEVRFSSHDPQLAAKVTNTLLRLFIETNYRTRYEAIMKSSEWLSRQLDDIRKKVQESNQALSDYQKASGIVDVDDKQNTITQKVAELNRQLIQAQADRIQLEASLGLLRSTNAELLPQVGDNPLIQLLINRLVDARGELAQAQGVYGKNNSNVKKLQMRVDEYQAQLTAEQQRITRQMEASYQAAINREKLTAVALQQMKAITNDMNEKMVRLSMLKHEAEANTDLYNTLFARVKETGIAAASKSSNVRVVDQARILDKPTGPHRLQRIVIGFFLGIFGGLGAVCLKEMFDNKVRTAEDIVRWTGFSSVSILPFAAAMNGHSSLHAPRHFSKQVNGVNQQGRKRLAATSFFDTPNSPEAEAVRRLETSLLLSRPEGPPRVLLVASSLPKEGKTTVAVNLAIALAQHGSSCLVDADIRKPMVDAAFGLSCKEGLTDWLTGSRSFGSVVVAAPGVRNLSILPVGRAPANPGDLLLSEELREVVQVLRNSFHYVVIDSAPIIPFADGRALTSLVDGVILVGRCGSTARGAIILGTQILAELHAPVVGVVLNGVDFKSHDYYCYAQERG